jgi:formamidopyrimidine-DNA glycosylase
MPELPEVETIRIQLAHVLPGKTIKSVQILKPKSFIGNKKLITGRKIVRVRRFGKMIVIDLTGGLHLVVHLKMTGQLLFIKSTSSAGPVPSLLPVSVPPRLRSGSALPGTHPLVPPAALQFHNNHTRVIIDFTDGDRLYFNDQRIFGWMKVAENPKLKGLIKNLGPDPLIELTQEKFITILQSSKRPVKIVLMDQEKIAGVGNIYACDALFLAGIDPGTDANELTNGQTVKLLNCLKKVLRDGVKWRGASRMNFRDIYGEKGEVQQHFHVYGREGESCENGCGSIIKRIKLGGRGTFYCPKCQRI